MVRRAGIRVLYGIWDAPATNSQYCSEFSERSRQTCFYGFILALASDALIGKRFFPVVSMGMLLCVHT